MDQSAGKDYRLRRRKDIARMFERGRRASDSLLVLHVLRGPQEVGHARLGVAVSGRHGNAVKRNRVKRLCREAFRLIRSELPDMWDYMIVPRVGRPLTIDRIQESLRALVGQLKNKTIPSAQDDDGHPTSESS